MLLDRDQLSLLSTIRVLEDAEPGTRRLVIVTSLRVVWVRFSGFVCTIRAGMFSRATGTGGSTPPGAIMAFESRIRLSCTRM
jgi:hypothetical protein